MTGRALGYAIITSIVILAVIIFTVVKLRKQVGKAEKKEKEKKNRN